MIKLYYFFPHKINCVSPRPATQLPKTTRIKSNDNDAKYIKHHYYKLKNNSTIP